MVSFFPFFWRTQMKVGTYRCSATGLGGDWIESVPSSFSLGR
jgi:hypothetical protein